MFKASIFFSISATWVLVTLKDNLSEFDVAKSAPRSKRSFCILDKIFSFTLLEYTFIRPIIEFNSSISPKADGLEECLSTLSPLTSVVFPSSPVLV